MKNQIMSTIKEITTEHFRFLVAIIIVIIFAIGWTVLISPKYELIQNNGALYYRRSVKKLEGQKQYLEQLKQLEKDYQDLNHESLKNLEYILPTEKDTAALLSQLETLAKDNDLDVITIDVSAPDTETTQKKAADIQNEQEELTRKFSNEDIKTLNIALSVTGIDSYMELRQFVEEIEKNMRLLDLKAFQYQSGQEVYAFDLTTYYLAE